MKFPFKAKLVDDNGLAAFAAHRMTKGNTYTITGWAGSCFVTTTDVPGETTMVHWERFEKVGKALTVTEVLGAA